MLRPVLAALLLATTITTLGSAPPVDAALPAQSTPGAHLLPGEATGEPTSLAASASSPAVPLADADALPSILINELANGGPGSDSDSFAELRNWGDETVDLSSWKLYRCSAMGLRANTGATESALDGVTLEPGGIVTVSKVGLPGAKHVTQPYANSGFGLWLERPDGALADRVGVYPNEPWPTQSECTPPAAGTAADAAADSSDRRRGRNLPNALDFAIGESWQRIGDTGDPTRDFVAAPATIDAPNRAEPSERATGADADVLISEITAEGPAGDADDFVELRNTGDRAVDVGGWQLFRCTASGRLRADTRQLTIADGTRIDAGETWLAAGPGFDGDADPDADYPTSFADVTFGALLRTDRGALVDRVAVSAYADSACQDGDDKLPAILDPVAGESYQRADGRGTSGIASWIVAPRTPGRKNAAREDAVFDAGFGADGEAASGVLISELATDPAPELLPDGMTQRNFVELANYGDEPVDIGGWTLRRCEADGVRSLATQAAVPDGTSLDPGGTWLAARTGTAAATDADARYATSLNFLGAGVWLADADGERVDSVGVYGRNEMDASIPVVSPCTKGIPLTTYQPDRMLQQSFQRVAFSGVDADDFRVAAATPGALRAANTDAVVTLADRASRVVRAPDVVTAAAGPEGDDGHEGDQGGEGDAAPRIASASGSSSAADAPQAPARVLELWAGSSAAPLAARVGDGEVPLDPGSPAPARDDGYGFPYQRLVVDGRADPASGTPALTTGSRVGWTGTASGRGELQLSVWSPRAADGAGAWRLLDAGSDPTGTGAPIALGGILTSGEGGPTVALLVQAGPRTAPTLAADADGELQDPADYDFAISHITDTQYLTESYPEVYARLTGWIADNANDRKIAFATHTGDLVQNWVDPDQDDDRARREFERASELQGILDDAGVPNSVLPGNHDSKRGVDYTLYDEYFGPARYADQPWFGGTIAPDDNTANYSLFEEAGAPFLMLSLPYAYGDREIAWAEAVVSEHPDRNVVVSTHEHVSPKTLTDTAHRSSASRWVSRADQLWNRVIAPNRNVVAVLSGHFHGLGQIVTEDAGGIPGHDVVELLADYQEFRTHTGERATGFQRLLQVDLASGTIAVDTFSTRLDASASYEYDYRQFLPDNGQTGTPSNDRPWNIVAKGLQGRYDVSDDEFSVSVAFQFSKSVATSSVSAAAPIAAAGAG